MIRRLTQGPRVIVQKINELIDHLNRSSSLRGDEFISVKEARNNRTISLNINKLRTRIGRQQESRGGGGTASPKVTATIIESLFDGDEINPAVDEYRINGALGEPAFDSTESYSTGAVVTYNGNTYTANTAVTAGAWNSAQWDLGVTAKVAGYEGNLLHTAPWFPIDSIVEVFKSGSQWHINQTVFRVRTSSGEQSIATDGNDDNRIMAVYR